MNEGWMDEVVMIGDRALHYALDGRPASMREWGEALVRARVALTELAWLTKHGCLISTRFIGMDLGWEGLAPLIYETMAFRHTILGPFYVDRYATWGEAVEGHRKAVHVITRRLVDQGVTVARLKRHDQLNLAPAGDTDSKGEMTSEERCP